MCWKLNGEREASMKQTSRFVAGRGRQVDFTREFRKKKGKKKGGRIKLKKKVLSISSTAAFYVDAFNPFSLRSPISPCFIFFLTVIFEMHHKSPFFCRSSSRVHLYDSHWPSFTHTSEPFRLSLLNR
jgi:hypothetical protein